jgi:Zn-dependent peptidase ImmA (M78 family)
MDLCNLCGIEYVFRRDIDGGFYYYTNGRPTIVVTTKGTAAYRAFVSWHEFAHHLQNYFRAQMGVSFLNVKPQSCDERHADDERLADVFAMVACNPRKVKITRPMDFINMLMDPERHEERPGYVDRGRVGS